MANRKHLSRLGMPNNWPISRKGTKWIMKPSPGPHSLRHSMTLNLVLKELLKYSKKLKGTKRILFREEILVNNKVRKNSKFPVGIMDVVSAPSANEYFRIGITKKNKFFAIPIKKDEATLKPCKITGKTILKKGKVQLNFYDGTNMLLDKNGYKVNDTLMLDLSGDKIKTKKHLPLDKGSKVIVLEGKFVGHAGTIEEIKNLFGRSTVVIKSGKDKFETSTKYVFVVDDSISYEVKK